VREDVPVQSPDSPEAADALHELRSLLIAPEQGELRDLRHRIDDPNLRARDVSAVLPEAVAMRPPGDRQLAAALIPAVSEVLRETLRRNPSGFADVFFPLLGPAIRKAIAKALADMVQSLNHVVEHTFTPRGLRWRFEALRTGKPFAEVVLLHSLVYRVEEVFLVHRETGLLLQNVVAQAGVVRDADMASAMLTAIRDFVRDTFQTSGDDSVEGFQFGELNVLVEQGPQALLAVVVRGTAPGELRSVIQETVERVHLEHLSALEAFEGDTAPFESAREILEECLRAQYAEETHKTSPLTWAVLALVALLLLGWAFVSWRNERLWASYQERLRAEPGIVLGAAETEGGKYVVTGLRDPRAADPATLATEVGLDPDDLVGRWEPFHSAHPPYALERAKEVLAPPQGVELSLDRGVLFARGAASARWVAEASRVALLVPGVRSFDATGVVDPELEALVRRLETRTVCFPLGVATLAPEQADLLREIAADVEALDERAGGLGRRARLGVVGYADQPGSDDLNLKLSRERAENVLAALGLQGPKSLDVAAAGAGARGGSDATARPQDSDRCVTFQIEMVRDAER
jgi:OOP family OmpA-OmpF porin